MIIYFSHCYVFLEYVRLEIWFGGLKIKGGGDGGYRGEVVNGGGKG